ncbi:MAG: sigma-70 family RNA polymerase sigma factor [Coprobacillus sp.]
MDRYTDDELIYLMRCGYQEAEDCLYQSYYRRIRNWMKSLYWPTSQGIDIDDYMQMMMVHFAKVIDSYRDDRNASLRTLVKLSMRRRIPSLLRKGTDMRIYRENILVSLDEYVNSADGMRYDEVVEDKTHAYQPQVALMIKETETYYQVALDNIISLQERDVMKYKRIGYSEDEIADMMNISVKSVYNAVYRYHKKVLSIDESKEMC